MEKPFEWNKEKNEKLIQERGISFEVIAAHLEAGDIIEVIPGQGQYNHQKQFIVIVDRYVYVVPFVEDEAKIFLKTIIPSRKWTRRYLKGDQ